MNVKHYELALQFLSRDENDGGFVAEAHVVAKLSRADLDLSLEQFTERYLRPAWVQAKAEHDRQFELVEAAYKRRCP